MEYNKDLLKSWQDDWMDYPEDDDVSFEEFEIIRLKRCLTINRRINYCKRLLANYKDAFIYYTLADLYNRYDFDEAGRILYKRDVRFYCIMAIRKDRNYAPAWVLLAETYWLLAIIVGAEAICDVSFEDEDQKFLMQELKERNYDFEDILQESQKKQIKYIEKAISCIKKVIKIEPFIEEYQGLLEFYFQERNEMYFSQKAV